MLEMRISWDELEVFTGLDYENDGKCYFCGITLEKSNAILRQARENVKRKFDKFAGEHERRLKKINNRWKKIEEAFQSFDLSIRVNTVSSDPARFDVPYWDELKEQITGDDDIAPRFAARTQLKKSMTIGDLLLRLKVSITGEGEVKIDGRRTSIGDRTKKELKAVEHNTNLAEEAVRISNKVLADKNRFQTLSWSPLRQHEKIRYKLPKKTARNVDTVVCHHDMKISVPICPICSDRFQVSESHY